MGVNAEVIQLEDWFVGEFFVEATVRDWISKFRWVVMVVYGLANHDFSYNFLR